MTSGTAVGEAEAGTRAVRTRSDAYARLERGVLRVVGRCYMEDSNSAIGAVTPDTAFDNSNEFLCAAVTSDLEDYMERVGGRPLEPGEHITTKTEEGWSTVKDIVDFTARTLSIEEYPL